MKSFGRATVSQFLEDRVVYRNLVPLTERVPNLDALRSQMGFPSDRIPRKSEPDYARVIVAMLQRARELEAPGTTLKRLVYVGDTRLNDGTAFANICEAGGWPGMAFIGSETAEPARTEVVTDNDQTLYLSNRWAALADFDRYARSEQFPVDAETAVIVDLDKTALGARGRNSHVIDQARVQAVRDTVATLLGDDFDQDAFGVAYERLNQVEFHPFTTDNQDYLAYLCLILGAGLEDLETVATEIKTQRLVTFTQFIERVDRRVGELPPALAGIHSQIYDNVRAGDPTPFKPFRRTEYVTTLARMGQLSDDTPIETMLAQEIVITQELLTLAQSWRDQGALLFGLSDKPDEASIPSDELAAQGYRPIHRQETHAVGEGE